MKGIIPSGPEVLREALVVIAGALLAALIVGHVPPLKKLIQDNWISPPAPTA